MGLFDNITGRIFDPGNISGQFKETVNPLRDLGLDTPEDKGFRDLGKGVGSLPPAYDKARDEAELKTKQEAIDKYVTLRDAEAQGLVDPTVNRVDEMQKGISGRLSSLREGRGEAISAKTQPQLQNIAEAGSQATRGVRGEGSRQFAQRAAIGTDEALANQQVEAQALTSQLAQEGGLQKLDTELTGFFNELASNRFSREISGLTTQMNEYLSAQGAKIGYDQLALEARKQTSELFGRFASSLGTEIDRGDPDTTTKTNYNSGNVTEKESIFNY